VMGVPVNPKGVALGPVAWTVPGRGEDESMTRAAIAVARASRDRRIDSSPLTRCRVGLGRSGGRRGSGLLLFRLFSFNYIPYIPARVGDIFIAAKKDSAPLIG